ncbi:MAG: KpsF/GutQ family sugar-phosphate isomerase [Beijerinckiaceae bacterium]|nr:KpsF/GutQ family sugar-phosphate isomerase [Beijerinckiaceae bacterium]
MTASNLTQNLASDPAVSQTRASALRTLRLERAGIAALEEALGQRAQGGLGDAFDAAVARIVSASGRTIVTGMGKSGHVARKIAATMASTGTPAYFVHPGEASHGDLGMVRQEDVILALSWSGETAELADVITYAKRFAIPLIAITSSSDSALGRQADVCLCLPKSEEACPNGLAPTTSTTMQLAVGDALSVALLEARGFTASDFRLYHPGGKLGASLSFVRDVMHAGDRLPLIEPDAAMGDAILEISAKGFGCVGVIGGDGKLIGIVTDGDLRRHMRPDLVTARVGDVMTASPRTIASDLLAAKALEILNTRKITALFVLDRDGRPEGIVHLHDLLRVGVA